MNARAKQRGVKGIVVDGRIRDLEELRADGLPVFILFIKLTIDVMIIIRTTNNW